jgi:16S rRNA (cytidine1402-2'-O)-methyltransferase
LATLYVVATPIGNLEDVTLRALRVLGEVGAIAAEDTRVTARLLARHGIRRPLISYRAPVERRGLPRVMAALDDGDVALVSDAGTPTLSDPGQRLVAEALAAGHRVVPVPGPSAITAALAASGLEASEFRFVGFLPRKRGELHRLFEDQCKRSGALVAFESPHRISRSLQVLVEVAPASRVVAGRELTKVHEEFIRGSPQEVLEAVSGRERGEFTLVIDLGS